MKSDQILTFIHFVKYISGIKLLPTLQLKHQTATILLLCFNDSENFLFENFNMKMKIVYSLIKRCDVTIKTWIYTPPILTYNCTHKWGECIQASECW